MRTSKNDFYFGGVGDDDTFLSKGSKSTTFVKCAHNHPSLKIAEWEIYGGSCLDPIIKDANIYVGFEQGMRSPIQAYPWNGLISFHYPIVDRNVPVSIDEFRKLLSFLADNLKGGKKIHLGCIGGHGRTGLVLAALVTTMTGNVDSISYVRTNYCSKAVESDLQVAWLNKHFGITKVAPSKANLEIYTGSRGLSKGVSKSSYYGGNPIPSGEKVTDGFVLNQTIQPFRVKGNCWGF